MSDSIRIYDCFTFFNELDILEIRLEELYDSVDRFVLVESDVGHSNQPKQLVFEANKQRFARFLDKITHIVVTDMPRDTDDSWVRENFQRNAILRGLDDARPDDLILIGDVDEIPARDIVAGLRRATGDVYGLRMRLCQLRLNYVNVLGREAQIVWTVALRRRCFELPQEVRDRRHAVEKGGAGNLVNNSGWHYSSMGDDAHVRNKILHFAHQEFNTEGYLATIDIADIIAESRDPYFRKGYVWSVVPIEWNAPEAVLRDPARWSHLIVAATRTDHMRTALLFRLGWRRFAYKLNHFMHKRLPFLAVR